MGCQRDFLEPDKLYHIFNHANGKNKLFTEERNYPFFMKKIEKWILPCCDIHTYCLIPNHFHFALKIKSEKELSVIFEEKISKKLSKLFSPPPGFLIRDKSILDDEAALQNLKSGIIEKLLSEQFSHCFNSYVQAFNKTYDRMGSLLKESFHRKLVDSDDYWKTLICYIHNNPVNHGIVKSPEKWKHSSYNLLFTEETTYIKRKEVIEIFGTLENLVAEHRGRLGKPRQG